MNLDSLMDTLTNVVGILLIILIFALIGGQEVVKRIKGFVDEISEDQLAAAAAESVQLRKLIDDQKEKWEEAEARLPQQKLTLEEQQRLLKQLQDDIAKLSAAEIDPEKLKSQLEAHRKEAAKLEAEVKARLEQIASLKARLADSPAKGAGADTKVVNLPDPRPAPDGAKPITFLCREGYIFPLDLDGLQKEAQKVVSASSRVLLKDEGIDCDRLKDLFAKRFVGDRYVQLGIRVGGDGKPYLTVQHREKAGEPTDHIDKPTSLFNRAIKAIDPRKNFIEFRVWSDSYDTYLVARNEAARQGIMAGWTPYAQTSDYSIPFGVEIKTTCIGFKAPPPSKPATPPDPNKPPPPPDVVD
ncbi:MAG: hypothetical protein ACK5Q5_05590 [Planctomycetaceae bacterium]